MQRLFLLCLLFACFSCGNEPENQPIDTPSIPLPNQPEAVVRQWQTWVDNNHFDKAALLSTPQTKEWLDMLQHFLMEEQDTMVFTTEFQELNCYENGTDAKCGYVLLEEGELFRDTFLLVKANGQWLVDTQEDVSEDEIKALMDSLMQVQ